MHTSFVLQLFCKLKHWGTTIKQHNKLGAKPCLWPKKRLNKELGQHNKSTNKTDFFPALALFAVEEEAFEVLCKEKQGQFFKEVHFCMCKNQLQHGLVFTFRQQQWSIRSFSSIFSHQQFSQMWAFVKWRRGIFVLISIRKQKSWKVPPNKHIFSYLCRPI